MKARFRLSSAELVQQPDEVRIHGEPGHLVAAFPTGTIPPLSHAPPAALQSVDRISPGYFHRRIRANDLVAEPGRQVDAFMNRRLSPFTPLLPVKGTIETQEWSWFTDDPGLAGH
jgi:hypothetical protein